MVILVISTGILVQFKEMVPALNMTLPEIIFIALPTCVCTLGVYIAISDQWAFPVPFGFILTTFPFTNILFFFFIFGAGKNAI